ncbi:MAG: toprim domain-containing protein [Eubacteriales bacterium]
MIKLSQAIVVEGKYDKIKLSSIIDAHIFTTDGFGIFTDTQRLALLRRVAQARGLIVVTDSDRSGFKIRSFLKGAIPPERLQHVILPSIKGKEGRKEKPSAQGLLGVEGTDAEIIRQAFARFIPEQREVKRGGITKARFYSDGLSGGEDSSARRARLSSLLDLPEMSANALLAAVNILCTEEEYTELINRLMTNSEGDF